MRLAAEMIMREKEGWEPTIVAFLSAKNHELLLYREGI